MNFKKEYQLILRPLIKASPVILGLIVISVVVMRRAITYMPPEFRAKGAIKINNLTYSESAFNVFGKKDGFTPKQSENFLTEVEVFQTRDLVKKTLENLDWEMNTYRVGKIRQSEMFEENPFSIDYQVFDEEAMGKNWYFEYLGGDELRILTGGTLDSVGVHLRMGDTMNLPSLSFSINKREDFLKYKPNCLHPGDRFAFRLNSMEDLISQYGGADLFVKPVEKDVAIIEIFFDHELPEKAQMFVNELMDTYIEEGQKSKHKQADETLAYLDEQLADVGGKLRNAEADLAHYRMSNHLINTMQQTDATLRELTQLDMQKLSLTMKTRELERLQDYLLSGEKLSDFSPNFDALRDPIFRESYLDAQAFETERKDLLQKYTLQNPKVSNVEEKIREYRAFLHTTVDETLSNLRIKGAEVESIIAKVGRKIKDYPEKERRLVVLQREMSLNEEMYNYLMQKRTEVAIASSSNMFPHKIIEHADRPRATISPNKPLLYGVAVLLALLAGMAFAYVRSYFKEKVSGKEDLEDIGAPVLGVVYEKEKSQHDHFLNLYGLVAGLDKLEPSGVKGQGKLFVVTSLVPGEGKSYTSSELAKAFAASGKQVLLIDMDVRKPTLHHNFKCDNNLGFSDILEGRMYALSAVRQTEQENLHLLTAGQLETNNYALLFGQRSLDFIYDYRWHFDVVIVDTPPLGIFEDSLPLMNESTANLFLVRAGFSKRRMLKTVDRLIRETGLPNLYLVLNGLKTSSKVSGYKKYIRQYYAEREAVLS